jgi:hypothetical protein
LAAPYLVHQPELTRFVVQNLCGVNETWKIIGAFVIVCGILSALTVMVL